MPVPLQSGGATSIGPLFPEGYDLVWSLVIAALVLLTVAALVRVARSRDLTLGGQAVWLLLVIFAPPLGGIAALLLVHRNTAPRPDSRN